MLLGNPDFSVTPTGLPAGEDDYLVSLYNGKILLKTENGVPFLPRVKEFELPDDLVLFELGRLSGTGLYSARPGSDFHLPEQGAYSYQDFNTFRDADSETAALLMAVRHLSSWYSSHRFCGRCGAPLTPDDKLRALDCSSCGNQVFPVICPAVITAVTCGDKILLARNKANRHRHPGLIAGYVEVGETLEHAVAREVMEEVGLKVENIRYVGNQPWGITGAHMLGFQATADASIPLCVQEDELSWAEWVSREDLEPREQRSSVAAEMIERFRTGTL